MLIPRITIDGKEIRNVVDCYEDPYHILYNVQREDGTISDWIDVSRLEHDVLLEWVKEDV